MSGIKIPPIILEDLFDCMISGSCFDNFFHTEIIQSDKFLRKSFLHEQKSQHVVLAILLILIFPRSREELLDILESGFLGKLPYPFSGVLGLDELEPVLVGVDTTFLGDYLHDVAIS